MSETNNGALNAQEELKRRLKAIGADLWGDAERAVERDFAAEAAPGNERREAGAGAQAGKAAEGRKLTLKNLWMTADETVDWTEALLYASPRDGLTPQKKWNFFHRIAPRVLAGEKEAYAEVLTTLNPLGDVAEYAAGMVLRTPGPDRVECAFECQKDDLEKLGRNYLGALSLRIARDLLAVLPVSEVLITGTLEGEEKLRVTFRREQLMKQKMAYIVPADFVEACGGHMS